jgi:translation elongation factor EF-4
VIRDRLEREYDIDLITTAPSVVYHIHMKDGSMTELHNPADMPDSPMSSISRSRGSRRPSSSPTTTWATC